MQNYKRNAYTKADLQCTNAYTKEVESCLPSDVNINNVAKILTGTVWSIKKQCKVLMISYVDDSGGLEATLGIKFIMIGSAVGVKFLNQWEHNTETII
uniref:Uncharacterized protein n=1 Tax=Cucumis melo TaxID=3656 RepID=A0A9I9E9U5_CUCME